MCLDANSTLATLLLRRLRTRGEQQHTLHLDVLERRLYCSYTYNYTSNTIIAASNNGRGRPERNAPNTAFSTMAPFDVRIHVRVFNPGNCWFTLRYTFLLTKNVLELRLHQIKKTDILELCVRHAGAIDRPPFSTPNVSDAVTFCTVDHLSSMLRGVASASITSHFGPLC